MLLRLGIRSNTNTASKAIGYRQAMDFLQVGAAGGSSPGPCGALAPCAGGTSRGGGGGWRGRWRRWGGAEGDATRRAQAAKEAGGASRAQLLQLIADVCTKSRQLVKNQHTWFRDDHMFRWLDVSERVRGGGGGEGGG
jgi:hypothetical protein